jgi:hypothetical protein
MTIGTIICALTWGFIIKNTSPVGANFFVFLAFYGSLFLSLVGAFSVLGFLIRRFFSKNDNVVFHHVKQTFRQSILCTILIISSLILLANKLLFWWNAIILLGIFISIEIFIATKNRARMKQYV